MADDSSSKSNDAKSSMATSPKTLAPSQVNPSLKAPSASTVVSGASGGSGGSSASRPNNGVRVPDPLREKYLQERRQTDSLLSNFSKEMEDRTGVVDLNKPE